MTPLKIHHADDGLGDFVNMMKDFSMGLKTQIDQMRKTGPAADHHMKALLPTHNIFKPGAHPSRKDKNDDKKDDKKDKKPESKADELRNRLKPVRIE